MARAPTSRHSGSAAERRGVCRGHTNAANPNASRQASALSQRICANLAPQNGTNRFRISRRNSPARNTAIKSSTDRQAQLKAMAYTMLDSIEGISADEVATKILALQTNLAGFVSDHRDAVPDHVDQVSADLTITGSETVLA